MQNKSKTKTNKPQKQTTQFEATTANKQNTVKEKMTTEFFRCEFKRSQFVSNISVFVLNLSKQRKIIEKGVRV